MGFVIIVVVAVECLSITLDPCKKRRTLASCPKKKNDKSSGGTVIFSLLDLRGKTKLEPALTPLSLPLPLLGTHHLQ
jgi:hypothetical protein